MAQLEFISPFALLNCKSRLQSRHEDSTLLAFRGQTRLYVHVHQRDHETCTFVLKKVPKSMLSGTTSTARLVGQMKLLDNHRTLITAEYKISIFWILFGSLLIGGVIGWMIFSFMLGRTAPTLQDYAVLVFSSIAGFAAMLLFTWWYALREVDFLTHILKESLGYEI